MPIMDKNFFDKLREKQKVQQEKDEQLYLDLLPDDYKLLSIIGSTEPSTFSELCQGLKRPDIDMYPMNKAGWGSLFQGIRELESTGYIATASRGGRMVSFILTPLGAAAIKDWADNHRPLIATSEDDDAPVVFNREEFMPEGKPF